MTPTNLLEIEYPSSDGKPMAENTRQAEWICTLLGGIDALFRDRDDVFVAADNYIFPIQGNSEARLAPDIYVAFGRPRGVRSSYLVWEENNIFPQVIMEILSPSNRPPEMANKFTFYEAHGAEEYYIYDPDTQVFQVYERRRRRLREVAEPSGFVSPRLGTRFVLEEEGLVVYFPDGRPIQLYREVFQRAEVAEQALLLERQRAEHAEVLSERRRLRAVREHQRRLEAQQAAEQAQQAAEQAQQAAAEEKRQKERAEQVAAEEKRQKEQALLELEQLHQKLRELGLDPATLHEKGKKQ